MRKKILIVEDNTELLELLRSHLRLAGFSTSSATTGLEALKKVESYSPDLILLDLVLPELDGFAVCEILRRDPVTCAIPILLLTAVSSQFARLTGLDAGASDYLTKPFSPRELVARVRSLLEGPIRPPSSG